MIAITIDTDWAPDPLIEEMAKSLTDHGIRGTFFLTNETTVNLDKHEIGLHPNFNLDKEPEEIISNVKHIAPKAIGIRSHSLFTSNRLQQLFHESGFKYSSNFFLDRCPNIKPVNYLGLVEVPAYFLDNLYTMEIKDRPGHFQIDDLKLEQEGLKVFIFHPTNVYLNLHTMIQHELAKPDWKNIEELSKLVNKNERGIKNLFNDLLTHISDNNVKTNTLQEIAIE